MHQRKKEIPLGITRQNYFVTLHIEEDLRAEDKKDLIHKILLRRPVGPVSRLQRSPS